MNSRHEFKARKHIQWKLCELLTKGHLIRLFEMGNQINSPSSLRRGEVTSTTKACDLVPPLNSTGFLK